MIVINVGFSYFDTNLAVSWDWIVNLHHHQAHIDEETHLHQYSPHCELQRGNCLWNHDDLLPLQRSCSQFQHGTDQHLWNHRFSL